MHVCSHNALLLLRLAYSLLVIGMMAGTVVVVAESSFVGNCSSSTTNTATTVVVEHNVTNTTTIAHQSFGPNVTIVFSMCMYNDSNHYSVCNDPSSTVTLEFNNVTLLNDTNVVVQAPSTGTACTVAASLNLIALNFVFGQRCSLHVAGTFCNFSSLSIVESSGEAAVDVIVSDVTLAQNSNFYMFHVRIGAFVIGGDALVVMDSSAVILDNVTMHSMVSPSYIQSLLCDMNATLGGSAAAASGQWSFLSVVRSVRVEGLSQIAITSSTTDLPMVWCFGCRRSADAPQLVIDDGALRLNMIVLGSSSWVPSILMDFSGTEQCNVSLSSYSRLQLKAVTMRSGAAFGGLTLNFTDSTSSTVTLQDSSMIAVDGSNVTVGGAGGVVLALLFDSSNKCSLVVLGGSRIGGSGGTWNCSGASCTSVSFVDARNGTVSLSGGSIFGVQGGAQIVSCDATVRVQMDLCEKCSVVVNSGSMITVFGAGTTVRDVGTAAVVVSFTSSRYCTLRVSSSSFIGLSAGANISVGTTGWSSLTEATGVAIQSSNTTSTSVTVTDTSAIGVRDGVHMFLCCNATVLYFDLTLSDEYMLSVTNSSIVGIYNSVQVTYATALSSLRPQLLFLLSLSSASRAVVSVTNTSSIVVLAYNSTTRRRDNSSSSSGTPVLLWIDAAYSNNSALLISDVSRVGVEGCRDCFPTNANVVRSSLSVVALDASNSNNFSFTVENSSLFGIHNTSAINCSSLLVNALFGHSVGSQLRVLTGSTVGVSGGSVLATMHQYVISVDLNWAMNGSVTISGDGTVVGVTGMSLLSAGGGNGAMYFSLWQSTSCDVSVSSGAVLGIYDGSTAVGYGMSGYGLVIEASYSSDTLLVIEGVGSTVGSIRAFNSTGVTFWGTSCSRLLCHVRNGGSLGIVGTANAQSPDGTVSAVFYFTIAYSSGSSILVQGTGSLLGVKDTICEPTYVYPAMTLFCHHSTSTRIEVTQDGTIGVRNATMSTRSHSALYMTCLNMSKSKILVDGNDTVFGFVDSWLPFDSSSTTRGFLSIVLDTTQSADVAVFVSGGAAIGFVRCQGPSSPNGVFRMASGGAVRLVVSLQGVRSLFGLRRSTFVIVGTFDGIHMFWNATVNSSLLVQDGAVVGAMDHSSMTSTYTLGLRLTLQYSIDLQLLINNNSHLGAYDHSFIVSKGDSALRVLFEMSKRANVVVANSSVFGASESSNLTGVFCGCLFTIDGSQGFTLLLQDNSVLGVRNSSASTGYAGVNHTATHGWLLYGGTGTTSATVQLQRGSLIGLEHNSTMSGQWYGLSVYFNQCDNVSIIVDSASQIGARGGVDGSTLIAADGHDYSAVVCVVVAACTSSAILVLDGSIIGVAPGGSGGGGTVTIVGGLNGIMVSLSWCHLSQLRILNNSSVEISGNQTTATVKNVGVCLSILSAVDVSVVIGDNSFFGARAGGTIVSNYYAVYVAVSNAHNLSVAVRNHSVLGYGWGGSLNANGGECIVLDFTACVAAVITVEYSSDIGVFVDHYRNTSSYSTLVASSPLPPLRSWGSAHDSVVLVYLEGSSNCSVNVRHDSRLGISSLNASGLTALVYLDVSNWTSFTNITVSHESILGVDARYSSSSSSFVAAVTNTSAAIFVNCTNSISIAVSVSTNSSIGICGAGVATSSSWSFNHSQYVNTTTTSTQLRYSAIHLYGFSSTALSIEVSGQGSFFGVSGSGSLYMDQAVCVNMSQSTVPSVSLSSGAFIGLTGRLVVVDARRSGVIVDLSRTVNASLVLFDASCIGVKDGATVTHSKIVDDSGAEQDASVVMDCFSSNGLRVSIANNSIGLGIHSESHVSGGGLFWKCVNTTANVIGISGNSTLMSVSDNSSVVHGGCRVALFPAAASAGSSTANASSSTVTCDASSSLIRVLASQVHGTLELTSAPYDGSDSPQIPFHFLANLPTGTASSQGSTVIFVQDSTMGAAVLSGNSSAISVCGGMWTVVDGKGQLLTSVAVPMVSIQRSVFTSSVWTGLVNVSAPTQVSGNGVTPRWSISVECSYWGSALINTRLANRLVVLMEATTLEVGVDAEGCTATASISPSTHVTTQSSLTISDGDSSCTTSTSVSTPTLFSVSLSSMMRGSRSITQYDHGTTENFTSSTLSLSLSYLNTRSGSTSTSPSTTLNYHSASVTHSSAAAQTVTKHAVVADVAINPTRTAMQGTVSAGSVVSALVLPTAALAARRVSLLTDLGNCNDLPDVGDVLSGPVDFMNAPLQLRVGVEYGAWHRGAVIGDAAVWVGCVVVGFVLTLVARRAGLGGAAAANESIVASAARLRLPGLYFIIVALLLQQVVVSSVLLLGYGGESASSAIADRVIGACGLLLSCVIAGSMARVLDPRRRCFRAVAEPAESGTQRRRWPNAVMRWLKAESVEWRPRDEAGDALFVERYGFLFESCSDGRHWWLLVDVLSTLVLGVVSGVVPATVTSCLAEVWFAVSLCAVQLVAVMALRPLNNRLEFGIVVLLYALQLVIALCSALNAAPDVVYVLGIVFSAIAALLAVIDLGDVFLHRVYSNVSESGARWRERWGDRRAAVNDGGVLECWTATEVWAHPALSKLLLLVCLQRGRCRAQQDRVAVKGSMKLKPLDLPPPHPV